MVLCWHMHQPQYRDYITGQYHLPWTYLHVIKDYVDMAAHLEAVPGARAVFNFAPILLEQIDDYIGQVRAFRAEGRPISDPLLNALASPVLPKGRDARITLAQTCIKANRKHLIEPYPPYRSLAEMVGWLQDHKLVLEYLSDTFFTDLLVWYHLSWMGETVKRTNPVVRRLMDKGRYFSLDDRTQLLEVIEGLLVGIIPRYRALAEAGRIEISFTPYAHPIMPLLIDLESARDAVPGLPLPKIKVYPGGEERVRWHIQRGIEVFEEHFGFRPAGSWPSEGSVSSAALALLADYGIRWAASGETVLANSLDRSGLPVTHDKHWLRRGYNVADTGDVTCFFRDDSLSDAIGFKYSDWHADDAVGNFISNLEAIAHAERENPNRIISIILDGENAWEYYPANGYHFLSALYKRLSDHPDIELTTYGHSLDTAEMAPLPVLVAGSWVYGTFTTWIGDKDKNRGWEMLGEAKLAFDQALRLGRLTRDELETATEQLAICEGSDWCWWFGDYNPSHTVSDFERLYRRHLVNLYQMIRKPPPEYLTQSFTFGGDGDLATGGVMRQGQD